MKESNGGFACLRALSSGYAEIVFRIHAEFLLDKEAPAYFTPAQFTGLLILNRKDGTIREFWLYLPPRNTNVDINAFNAADMVFVPRMELIGQNTDDQSDIVWKTAITEQEARSALEASFYKFSEIKRLSVFANFFRIRQPFFRSSASLYIDTIFVCKILESSNDAIGGKENMLRAFIAAFSSVVMLLLATSTNASLDEDLVFYLTFDNVKDQTIIDASGKGLDAEIHKNTEIVKGKYGDAIHFTDEGADCVNIASEEKLKVIGEITMMAWVYSPETWNGKKAHWLEKDCHFVVPIGWAHCYGIAGIDAGNGPEIWLLLGSQVDGGWGRQEFVTPHKMDEKKWHHVVGSYDGETMKIYLDGTVIGEEKKKFEFFGDNDADLRIGCAKNVPHLTFTNGSIDETAVWQRALSDNEIKQAMAGDFLAVSPSDKVATTWADMKKRVVASESRFRN